MTNNADQLIKRRQVPFIRNCAIFNDQKKEKLKINVIKNLTHHELTEELVKTYLFEHPQFTKQYFQKHFMESDHLGNFDLNFERFDKRVTIVDFHRESNVHFSLFPLGKLHSSNKCLNYISHLTACYEEAHPKSSLLKCLEVSISESVTTDEIKIYLVSSDGKSIHRFFSTDDKKNLFVYESYDLEDNGSLGIIAIKLDCTVFHPNNDKTLVDLLKDFKSINTIMAKPIRDHKGAIYGVIELIRHKTSIPFNDFEEEIVESFMNFSRISYFFIEHLTKYSKSNEMHKYIMRVTQTIFSNFRQLDTVIIDILKFSKLIVKANRSAFFMVEKESNELIAKILDVGNSQQSEFVTKKNNIKFPIGKGIAGLVAQSGEILNIDDVYNDERFNQEIDIKTGYRTKSLLTIPVKLKNEVVGVLQIVNKIHGIFTKQDEEYLQTFAVYCGIALYIAKMYKKIRRSEQKYKVAVDVLSYHSCYDPSEFKAFQDREIPVTWPEISDFNFCPWEISELDHLVSFLYMFENLFGFKKIKSVSYNKKKLTQYSNWTFSKSTLMKFILTVKKNYRAVPYHNWNHAFSVGHAAYTILMHTNHQFDTMESMAIFISCFCHDLDHRGQTNDFVSKNDDLIGSMYSTSTMEHHHFQMTVSILQRKEHNIFENISPDEYSKILGLIRHCIIGTDLNLFFSNVKKVKDSVVENTIDWNILEKRLQIMELLMTACDLCAMYKPWDKQLTFVKIIMQEFWDQGDIEKQNGQIPHKMMDRDYIHELPDLEIGFIEFVCKPCYETLSKVLSGLDYVVDQVNSNLDHWKLLKALPLEEKKLYFTH